MNPTDPKPLGLVICMPTRGAVSIETMLSLRDSVPYPQVLKTVFRKPVVEARNQLAKEAREVDETTLDFEPRYVLWVDDDAWWPAATLERAVNILEANPDVSMLAGAFSQRAPYFPPSAATTAHQEVVYLRYEPGELIPLAVAGGVWWLMRRELLNIVGDEPFNRLPFTLLDKQASSDALMPEDHSFCVRVKQKGQKIVTERMLRVAHVDIQSGLAYEPFMPPLIANGVDAPLYDLELTRADYPTEAHSRWNVDEKRWEAQTPNVPDEAPEKRAPQTFKKSAIVKFLTRAADTASRLDGTERQALLRPLKPLIDRAVTPLMKGSEVMG